MSVARTGAPIWRHRTTTARLAPLGRLAGLRGAVRLVLGDDDRTHHLGLCL